MTLSFLSIERKISRCSSPQLSMAVMFSDMDAPQRQISSSGGERFKCSMCVSESFVRLVCGVRVCTLAECLRCRSGVDYLLREVLLLRHSSFHPSRSNLCFSSTIMSAVMTSSSQCESVFRPIPHSLGARCS